jgi:hypothetical protein
MAFNIAIVLLLLVFVTGSLAECDNRSYTPDGSCNNINHPAWGATGRSFLRGREGYLNPNLTLTLPSPRVISNVLSSLNGRNGPINEYNINMNEAMFGQAINHDIQSTLKSNVPKFILLPPGDIMNNISGTPLVGPNQWAIIVSDTVTNEQGDVTNSQNSWFDLSFIYGLSESDDIELRNLDGTLKTSSQWACAFPPPDFANLPCDSSQRVHFEDLPPSIQQVPSLRPPDINFSPRPDGTGVFNDADFRVNNNVALTMIHTLYIRNHNRLVEKYREDNAELSGDDLYKLAKKINIAMYQYNVFYEYLPTIIPNIPRSLFKYNGYNSSVVPDTSYVFDLVGFRYGHSVFESYTVVDKCNNSFQVAPDWYTQTINPFQDPKKLVFAGTSGPEPFLIPDVIAAARNMENVWYSLIYGHAGKADLLISDDLRNLGLGFFPIDLFATDILRGRLAGIPDYYKIRKVYYGLYNFGNRRNLDYVIYGKNKCPSHLENNPNIHDPIECFSYITSDIQIAEKLKNLYGKVNKIDAIVGALAENVPSTYRLPPTISHIIFEEYNRKRVADRFWYENTLNEKSQRMVKEHSFAKLLKLNFDIARTFKFNDGNAFLVPEKLPGECRKKNNV